jgi:cystathionine beta-synthase
MPPHPIYSATDSTPVSQIVETFKARGISQVPVVDAKGNPTGMVHEVDVLRGLQSGEISASSPAKKVSHAIGGLIYPKARIEELFRIFETDQVGVVVDNGKIVGIVSKVDVLEFMTRR